MRPLLRVSLLAVLAAMFSLAIGCGGAREIQTQPPRLAVADTLAAIPDRTALTVTLAIDGSVPDEVAALRLRVGALWLKPAGAPWMKRPVGSRTIESGASPVRLLAADVPGQRYDSLAVVLTDPFVTFGPNAGGPVTIPDSGLVRLPLSLDLQDRPAAVLRLRLDPAQSLYREDGRWQFRPHLSARLEPR